MNSFVELVVIQITQAKWRDLRESLQEANIDPILLSGFQP